MNKKTFGGVISFACRKKKLNQKQLAEKIIREDGDPISPQYLNDIEYDRRSPYVRMGYEGHPGGRDDQGSLWSVYTFEH